MTISDESAAIAARCSVERCTESTLLIYIYICILLYLNRNKKLNFILVIKLILFEDLTLCSQIVGKFLC